MFDHLLESSRWHDSNKWSNIGFGQEIDVLEIKIRTLLGALDVLIKLFEYEIKFMLKVQIGQILLKSDLSAALACFQATYIVYAKSWLLCWNNYWKKYLKSISDS